MDNYLPPAVRTPRTPRTPASASKRPAHRTGASSSVSNGSPMRKRTADFTGSPSSKRPVVKREKKAVDPKKDPKLAIGIDFGTTYSGVGFAWSEKADLVDVVMSWNDSNQDLEKVPTAISFDANLRGERCDWGYGAKGTEDVVEWFKLLLVDEEDLPEEVRTSQQLRTVRNRLKQLQKTTEEVVASYLGALWKHCIEKIKVVVGEETVDYSRFHVVLTLPAIWPNYARERMRRAAAEAGILQERPRAGSTTLTFVSEPEAAALATMSNVDGRIDIQKDDSFVVVDCGGGTVDTISYSVIKNDPVVVRETVAGKGALCGAVFVDEGFSRLLKRKLREISKDACDRVRQDELNEIMSRDWEYGIRNHFTGVAQAWTIRLPYSLISSLPGSQNGRHPTFTVSSDEIEEVFEPVVQRIKALVQEQINAVWVKEGRAPKYVILVGGFGRCKYLYEYLRKRSLGVEVLQSRGAAPWTAVCRGAVIHGMMLEKIGRELCVEVRSRISRASYGIICQEDWEEDKHSVKDKVYDEAQQCWKAQKQIKWLVKEGEVVAASRKFQHKFFKILDKQPLTHVTTIWMSKSKPPPHYMDDSVTNLCQVQWDTTIDVVKLPWFYNGDGQAYKQLVFTTEMKYTGGSIDFAIIHGGKRQASKNVTVDFYDHGDV